MSSWIAAAADFLTTASGAPSREVLYLMMVGMALLQIWESRCHRPRDYYYGEPLVWTPIEIPYLADGEGDDE